MKKTATAAAVFAGLTVPALFGTVFLFGCCVLPFHQVMHRLMPVCEMAAQLMRGEQPQAHDDSPLPAPVREKQATSKELLPAVSNRFAVTTWRAHVPAPASARNTYRSFIAHGALRCDDDIGLQLLGHAFLI